MYLSVKYFKNIYGEYKSVAIDTKTDMKAHPYKASAYLSAIGLGLGLIWSNPSSDDFSNRLKENMNELMTVGEPIRNPLCDSHMQEMANYCNAGVLKRFTIGFFSLMWVDNYGEGVDLFEAQCKYLKIGWLEWRHRVVDVGVLGRWWVLDDRMKDYDINPQEWAHLETINQPAINQLPAQFITNNENNRQTLT